MATSVPTVVGSIVETTSDGSISIPNTTPPAVGDFLVAFIGAYISGGSRTLGTTPAGWTLRANVSGDEEPIACYTKVADSGDVSAGNFTFTISSSADVFTGVVIKVTNYASVAGSEVDQNESGSSITSTTSLTATSPSSLLLSMYFGADGGGSVISIGSYVSTPSLSWTELVDLQGDNGSPVATLSVAYANNTGTSTITSRGATASASFGDNFDSIAILINSIEDATGTNALFAVSPFLPSQNGVAGATGTNALHENSVMYFDQSGVGEAPAIWSNQTQTPSEWVNEQQ